MTGSLDYVQRVLLRVRFDKELFERELIETAASLDEHSLEEFHSWCANEFGPESSALIRSFNEKEINIKF